MRSPAPWAIRGEQRVTGHAVCVGATVVTAAADDGGGSSVPAVPLELGDPHDESSDSGSRSRSVFLDHRRSRSPFHRGRPRRTRIACAQLTDDLGAVTAGVIDPLALATGTRWVPVSSRPRRVLGRAGLDDDSVTTRSGWSYTTTDVTNEHSLSAEGAAVTRWPGSGDVERDTGFEPATFSLGS